MQVLSTKNLKWLGLAVAGLFFFSGVGQSVADVTVDLPVRKIDPLTGECVAFLVGRHLITCHDKKVPHKYRNEPTFPHATYEQLLEIHKSS
jgi:hypothetical protein